MLLTSLHLVSHLVTSVQCSRGEGGGTSAEIISSLCQKAKRWIGYLRKGIGPLCTLWIIHCNMHGCHTLVLLTFLYLTVKNSFSFLHLFSALVFAITMFQSCLVPTVTRNTQKDRQSFFWCSNYRPYLFETKSLVEDIRKCQIQVIFHLSPKAMRWALRKHYFHSLCIMHEPWGPSLFSRGGKGVLFAISNA